MENLINELVASLELYKEVRYEKYTAHVLETSMRVIGLKAQNMRVVLKALREKTVNWPKPEKLLLAHKLIDKNILECQMMAFEYLAKDKKLFNLLTEADLDGLNKNLDNWCSVDTYSLYLMGPAWRTGVVDDEKIRNYLQSENVWQRRIAVVSTVALNLKSQGGTGDVKRTLDICKRVVEDYDDMIVKALSWALRELSKREKEAVQEFIDRYDEVLHKKVLKEVTHKLVFGTKN